MVEGLFSLRGRLCPTSMRSGRGNLVRNGWSIARDKSIALGIEWKCMTGIVKCWIIDTRFESGIPITFITRDCASFFIAGFRCNNEAPC